MDKNTINLLCSQIIAGANSVAVVGETNMAQLLGICRAARQIAELVNREEERVDG